MLSAFEAAVMWLPVLVFGASVGSFLNVVVYRLPNGLSLLQPGSHCPKCKTALGPTDNVPVLGWLWLRGRCRHCGVSIPIRYPAVEALTMGLYALCFAVFGWSGTAALAVILVTWLIPLALIDLDTFLLPEELTRSALVLGLASRVAIPLLAGIWSAKAIAASVVFGILGAVVGILSLEAIGWIGRVAFGKEVMGLGDGKLLAAIGMWLGWQQAIVTLFVGCVLGVLGSAVGMTLRKAAFGRPIPFGPYLVIGGMVALFAGQQLVDAYLSLTGLDSLNSL
ncbi:MAG: prepilin peptidase [Cyanobacteria bacterium P01_F01_bin.33]